MTRPERWTVIALVAWTLTLAAPGDLAGQGRGAESDWWRWALAEVLLGQELRTTDRLLVRIDPERFLRPHGRRHGWGKRPGMPAFCRSGQGHPVFGRAWCVRKGFGLGRAGWRRGDLGDVVFRRVPGRDGALLDRASLGEILGVVVLERLLSELGLHRRVPVSGRWLELADRRGQVLQIRSGSRPLAELTDLDRDGGVDVMLVRPAGR